MPDLLVKLYDIDFDPNGQIEKNMRGQDIFIKRACIVDKHIILDFVSENFGQGWTNECECAMLRNPVSCYIAVKDKKIIGFACYDAVAKGFFGPTGVKAEFRGKGVGSGLLFKCLNSMKECGYGYAVIGWVGEAKDFYAKQAGAVEIGDSPPNKSVYKNMISQE